MDIKSGTLVVNGKTVQVKFLSKKGKEVLGQIPEAELSAELTRLKLEEITQLNNVEVDFNPVMGQPKRVRRQGEAWQPPQTSQRDTDRGRRSGHNYDRSRNDRNSQQQSQHHTPIQGDFHNPYNFVPAIPRLKVEGELGDRPPSGHGQLLADHWTGQIKIQITTKTPLLIPDAASLSTDDQKHKTYPLRKVGDQPYLPPTSVKGMLRSTFEMVTNSRLSVFGGHEDKLAFRMDTRAGQTMVPVRIAKNAEEKLEIQFHTGTSGLGKGGLPSDELYAAWLPAYGRTRLTYINGGHEPQHGDQVSAWVEKVKHYRWNRGADRYKGSFTYWRVLKIAHGPQRLLGPDPSSAGDPPPPASRRRNTWHQRLGESMKISGYVCKTGNNSNNKHDERIFFAMDTVESVPLEPKHISNWKNLITNYQETHEDELTEDRPSMLNPPREWSRHIKNNGRMAKAERRLEHGSLCFAQVTADGSEVTGLYPVTLSRDLFECSPNDLLNQSLTPASSMDELSPADRVFGWVNGAGKGAYKGQLRVNVSKAPGPDSVQHFDPPIALTILGEPKPQQTRFYVADNQQGQPLKQGKNKSFGYKNGQGIRGRKVYPHHGDLPQGYWKPQRPALTKRSREYLSSGGKSNQNRSIKAWVKTEQKFEFEINVANLSMMELGALLWILQLPVEHYHRLGGGKPLGFGSVQVTIVDLDLRCGNDWKKFYGDLIEVPKKPEQDTILQNAITYFKEGVEKAYSHSFDQIPFIAAFLKASAGFTKPIHYPRTDNPQSKVFDWFVANEKNNRLALSELTGDTGLPLNP